MTVMILERVSPSLRGQLTRWMIQPKTGVFVGRVSARVRDLLWLRVCRSVRKGAAVMIYNSDTEQGFDVRTVGQTSKVMEDFEGLILPKTPKSA
jgi:CRISPR-associated protein Cas2